MTMTSMPQLAPQHLRLPPSWSQRTVLARGRSAEATVVVLMVVVLVAALVVVATALASALAWASGGP